MLIEQIIEFESKVPGLLVVHIPKTGYFYDKTKRKALFHRKFLSTFLLILTQT